MIITAIGQVGISTPSGQYTLTPSLAAIASMTDPVEMYSDLTSTDTPHEWRVQVAHDVIMACTDDKSINQYLGMRQIGKPRLRKGVVVRKYSSVYVTDAHAVIIAENLLFHGMIGKIEHKTTPSVSDYTATFKPIEWMAAVVAHLGITERDAWQMTMTSILSALKTKFPPSEKEKARANFTPESKAEHDEWYASIYGPQS